jgi:hypothetical protein
LSRYYGVLHRLLASLFPDYHLLALGYCLLSFGFCLVRGMVCSFSSTKPWRAPHRVLNFSFPVDRRCLIRKRPGSCHSGSCSFCSRCRWRGRRGRSSTGHSDFTIRQVRYAWHHCPKTTEAIFLSRT